MNSSHNSSAFFVALLAFCCLVLAVPAQVASAVTLLNPSFEEPPGTNTFFPGETIGSGWVVESAPTGSVVIHNSTDPNTWHPASDGVQQLYMGNHANAAVVYQDIALDALTIYRLTFDLAALKINFGVSSAALLDVDILLNGSSILGNPVTFTRPPLGGFEEQELNFTTSSAGIHRLLLSSGQGDPTNVDNFTLTALAVTNYLRTGVGDFGMME